MQINLQQPEIIAAIALYITQQGINLKGKDVLTKFTAGRGENGLSAEIHITENNIPDFGGDDVPATELTPKPVLAVVREIGKTPAPKEYAVEGEELEQTGHETEVKPTKTSSLFA